MAIKISISSAKRLGYSIKGYVFDNTSKVPIVPSPIVKYRNPIVEVSF